MTIRQTPPEIVEIKSVERVRRLRPTANLAYYRLWGGTG